ncbi:MAG: PAS domain-containing protein, partial [Proteobacteria bacterium]|nr:PAS domain-containing protein [Pseudomonadota bacterium]
MADNITHIAVGSIALDATAALDALPSALLIIDRTHRILFVNGAAEELFNQSRERLIGSGCHAAWGEKNHSIEAALEGFFEKGMIVRVGELRLMPGGKAHRLCLVPLGEEGSLALAIFEPEESEAFAGAGSRPGAGAGAGEATATMAAVLAHEVKNPLAGIRGAAQLLEKDVPESSRHLTGLIQAECDRIMALVDRMDMLSNPPPTSLHALNIHEILDHVLALESTAFEGKVLVEKRFDPSLPLVMADRDLLIQLFLNLVRNALEASDDPRILITTRYRQGARAVRVGNIENGYGAELPIEITIAD